MMKANGMSVVITFSENGQLNDILLYAPSDPGQKVLQKSLAALLRPKEPGLLERVRKMIGING